MRLSALRPPLAIGFLLGATVLIRVAAWPLVRVELPARAPLDARERSADSVANPPAAQLALIVSRDPFRIGRRPAPVAYDPLRLAEQLAPTPPRPALLLVGMVDGADPSAVIEGLPGVEGSRIVRVGDVVSGLQVKRIGSGRVVISGMDTTWVLEVREPWRN